MESVAIAVIVVVGIASLALAVLGTYRNVKNPQAEVIRTLLEEIERLNAENKNLRDYILFLTRTAPVVPIPIPVNIINNQRSGGTEIGGNADVDVERDLIGGGVTKRDDIK